MHSSPDSFHRGWSSNRREFLARTGLAAAAAFYPQIAAAAAQAGRGSGREIAADIVIVGGGLGGCAAALAATRAGRRVILTEPTDWIGGQITQQGVPPDEHRWIETEGCTAAYRAFRTAVRDHYRTKYPLTDAARNDPHLNPGGGSVSRLCCEPRAALAALDAMLAPAVTSGRLRLMLGARPVRAETDGDRVKAIAVIDGAGDETWLTAPYFIDASELGDLLPLTGTEFVIGAESRADTGEEHAPEKADSQNIQAFTWCFAIDHLAGENHVIDKPEDYSFWRDYVPSLTPPWPGRLLSLTYSHPRTLQPRELAFVPPAGAEPPPATDALNLWLYRRIVDPRKFKPGTYPSGVTLVNWPQNDCLTHALPAATDDAADESFRAGRQLSLSLLYWLQTEAPRPDGGTGWPGLRLRGDLLGTSDGLAKFPYIRESRRIRAETTIFEHDVTEAARKEKTPADERVLGTPFPDSVGVGYYHLDLHPSTGGDNYIDMASVPFRIPLGALIPRRIENLIAGSKNIGTTHISNGCYRLHPVEWNIGEAAGALAARCLGTGTSPRAIRNDAGALTEFQDFLVAEGFQLAWGAEQASSAD